MTLIDDVYPNPYRYGYFVDIREPAAETPSPMKYSVMGRDGWEQPISRATSGCLRLFGRRYGIYEFVADEPIPEYDNTDDMQARCTRQR